MRTLSLSWSGARQGIITSGLNHVAHAGARKINSEYFLDAYFEENTEPKPGPSIDELIDKGRYDKKYGINKSHDWVKRNHRYGITTKKYVLEWDSKKGEVEVYSRGLKKHLGGFDPYNASRRISKPQNDRTPNRGYKLYRDITAKAVVRSIMGRGLSLWSNFISLQAVDAAMSLNNPSYYNDTKIY